MANLNQLLISIGLNQSSVQSFFNSLTGVVDKAEKQGEIKLNLIPPNPAEAQKVAATVNGINDQLNKGAQSADFFTESLGKLALEWYALNRVVKAFETVLIGASREAAKDEVQILALSGSFGQFARKAIESVEKLEGSIAKQDLIEAVNKYAALAESLEIAGDGGIEFAISLTKISAEISKIRGLDFDSVVNNISKGLFSNGAAARKYGINLSQPRLETAAREQGRNLSDLSDREVVLLKYNEVLRQTSKLSAEAARASQTMKGAQDGLKVSTEELQSTIGKSINNFLKPYINSISDATNGLNKFAKESPEFADAIGSIGIAVTGLTTAFAALVGGILVAQSAYGGFKALQGTLGGLQTAGQVAGASAGTAALGTVAAYVPTILAALVAAGLITVVADYFLNKVDRTKAEKIKRDDIVERGKAQGLKEDQLRSLPLKELEERIARATISNQTEQEFGSRPESEVESISAKRIEEYNNLRKSGLQINESINAVLSEEGKYLLLNNIGYQRNADQEKEFQKIVINLSETRNEAQIKSLGIRELELTEMGKLLPKNRLLNAEEESRLSTINKEVDALQRQTKTTEDQILNEKIKNSSEEEGVKLKLLAIQAEEQLTLSQLAKKAPNSKAIEDAVKLNSQKKISLVLLENQNRLSKKQKDESDKYAPDIEKLQDEVIKAEVDLQAEIINTNSEIENRIFLIEEEGEVRKKNRTVTEKEYIDQITKLKIQKEYVKLEADHAEKMKKLQDEISDIEAQILSGRKSATSELAAELLIIDQKNKKEIDGEKDADLRRGKERKWVLERQKAIEDFIRKQREADKTSAKSFQDFIDRAQGSKDRAQGKGVNADVRDLSKNLKEEAKNITDPKDLFKFDKAASQLFDEVRKTSQDSLQEAINNLEEARSDFTSQYKSGFGSTRERESALRRIQEAEANLQVARDKALEENELISKAQEQATKDAEAALAEKDRAKEANVAGLNPIEEAKFERDTIANSIQDEIAKTASSIESTTQELKSVTESVSAFTLIQEELLSAVTDFASTAATKFQEISDSTRDTVTLLDELSSEVSKLNMTGRGPGSEAAATGL